MTIQLTESQFGVVPLTAGQAQALEHAGARLASGKEWWGDDPAEPADRSLIRCRRQLAGGWQVRVSNAVGVIAVDGVELVVQPKIDLGHFLYLLDRAEQLPRHDHSPATLAAAPDLWRLVARWYVGTAEDVIRLGLISDYSRHTEALPFARGSIQPRETARAYYAGRTALVCAYDRFAVDTPANRVLRAAARTVAAAASLPWTLRRRARAASEALDGAGELEPGDLTATEHIRDRRLKHYRPALTLASQVLGRTGRTIDVGGHPVWTFLLPTPRAIEQGIREVLRAKLGDAVHPTGSRKVAGVPFNPDIVFPGVATADVKYKLAGSYWDRADLYQAIAFATAYEVSDAAVFNFATANHPLPEATPGRLRIRHIPWIADPAVPPDTAAADFANRVAAWLQATSTATPTHAKALSAASA